MVEIGQRYKDNDPRIKPGDERVGEVIDVDVLSDRARIRWNTGRETWVKIGKLGSKASNGYSRVDG